MLKILELTGMAESLFSSRSQREVTGVVELLPFEDESEHASNLSHNICDEMMNSVDMMKLLKEALSKSNAALLIAPNKWNIAITSAAVAAASSPSMGPPRTSQPSAIAHDARPNLDPPSVPMRTRVSSDQAAMRKL